MGSGKRASMREGPLANLFRKTETEGLEPRAAAVRGGAAGPVVPERATPTPQERLRHAFSQRDPGRHDGPARRRPRYVPPPSRTTTSGARCAIARVGTPQLRVVGVGGGGVNAVNRMIEAEVSGVEFIALNTDAQSLQQSSAHVTLQIGADITRGLGSGSDPDRGPRGRDGGLRPHQVPAQGLGHGVHHRRRGRRHRHRRGAGRRARGARARRADGRHRHQAVRLRGLAPPAGRRGRHHRRWPKRSTR